MSIGIALGTQLGRQSRGTTVPAALLTSGLVAEYRFLDGSGQVLTDSTANALNGQLGTGTGVDSSDPTWTTQGLVFDGVDDQVTLGNPALLNPTAITFGMVFRTNQGVDFSNFHSFVRHDGHITPIQWNQGNNDLVARFWTAGGRTDVQFDAAAYKDNGWHHYVFSYDSAGGLGVYLDDMATAKGGAAANGALVTNASTPFMLGRSENGNEASAGAIAYVYIYNRALTGAERTANDTALRQLLASRVPGGWGYL